MLQVFKKFSLLGILICCCYGLGFSQGQKPHDPLDTFNSFSSVEEQFQYFFETPEKYVVKSAYEWRDKVEFYLAEAKAKNDSASVNKYKVILTQIQYDLGDYGESSITAAVLYQNMKALNLEEKRYLLDIMDANYAELKLYPEQLEIRKEKKKYDFPGDKLYDVYENLGLFDKAMNDFMFENKNISEGDHLGKAMYWNQIGDYLRKRGTLDNAYRRYNAALGYLEVFYNTATPVRTAQELAQADWLMGIITGNIGRCKLAQKKHVEAIPDLEKAIEIIREHKQKKYAKEEVGLMLDLAQCHLKLGNNGIAKSYLSTNLPIKDPNSHLKRNQMLAEYFDRKQQFDSASLYYKKYIRLKDSLDNRAVKLQALGLLVNMDVEKQENKIKQQQKDIEESKGRIEQKDQTLTNTYIALGLTLLAISGLFLAYRKTVRSRRVINEQKKIIESSLVEKDSLLKEIHHRVKNNLQMVSSLLSIQAKNTKSKAAIEALEEGKSRVKAMALIHQKLYQNDDLSVIEMQGYIETLVNSIKALYKRSSSNIDIQIEAADTELDIDRAIPFGLILNELVSNSFKYAFPNSTDGTIKIKLQVDEKKGFFEYTDNGIGLPSDMEERSKSSMGFNLVNRLVNQLKSHLNIDEKADGVRFWFNFS